MSQEYKEKRRRELLEVAENVFIEKGFASTTMTDIVSASGMSRGGVYQYFSSTDEMYQEIKDEKDKEAISLINKINEEHESAWDAVLEFVRIATDGLESPSRSFPLVSIEYFVMSIREKERIPYYLNSIEKWYGELEQFFQKGVESGEFNPVQPIRGIISFIVNILDGLIIQTFTFNYESAHIKDQVEGLKLYLRHALGVQSSCKE